MATFAERLTQALLARNMTAAELSRSLGINEGTISQYKSGAYEPKQRRTQAIAKILNVSIDWLMGAEVPMQEKPSVITEQSQNIINLSEHEQKLVMAYRKRPDRQNAIDVLLGIADE